MILQYYSTIFQCFILSSSTSDYMSKHHLNAYALATGITTLSAQHCSQGTQVFILAKAETFECLKLNI